MVDNRKDFSFSLIIVAIVAIVGIIAILISMNEKKMEYSLTDQDLVGSAAGMINCNAWLANAKKYGGCEYLHEYAGARIWQMCSDVFGRTYLGCAPPGWIEKYTSYLE